MGTSRSIRMRPGTGKICGRETKNRRGVERCERKRGRKMGVRAATGK